LAIADSNWRLAIELGIADLRLNWRLDRQSAIPWVNLQFNRQSPIRIAIVSRQFNRQSQSSIVNPNLQSSIGSPQSAVCSLQSAVFQSEMRR
jgi:hypothetical protein